eukprot:CAMPEP_0167781652 /NCGR_PEP_ID=MMETSP0111_2-20121227/6055_1 /TAXON_ID=91324 /ORGANISM="Lotharella globosa, Strain CCCM811" /LENGTH=47 /DNA_ID= /DNA_START= /DNA_END= /DNA_ORIENTATION=
MKEDGAFHDNTQTPRRLCVSRRDPRSPVSLAIPCDDDDDGDGDGGGG